MREIFDDWLTRAAGLILVLIVGMLLFNTISDLPTRFPLLGMVTFTMEPVLFVIGGLIFILAIRRV